MRLPLPGVTPREDFGGARVEENVPVAGLTTLRVGPVARRVITCSTSDQIVATMRALAGKTDPVLVLGGGSNVVVADDLTGLTTWNTSSDYYEIRALEFNPADPGVVYAGFEGE